MRAGDYTSIVLPGAGMRYALSISRSGAYATEDLLFVGGDELELRRVSDERWQLFRNSHCVWTTTDSGEANWLAQELTRMAVVPVPIGHPGFATAFALLEKALCPKCHTINPSSQRARNRSNTCHVATCVYCKHNNGQILYEGMMQVKGKRAGQRYKPFQPQAPAAPMPRHAADWEVDDDAPPGLA